jgi:hypothetical protein
VLPSALTAVTPSGESWRGPYQIAPIGPLQLVVLVEDVDGVQAGREGFIMGLRDDMVTVGCQSRDRLHLVLARTWQVLPRELFRRLSARERGINE